MSLTLFVEIFRILISLRAHLIIIAVTCFVKHMPMPNV